MPDAPNRATFITLDELHPCVDFAAAGDQQGPTAHQYRIPGQHFLLVERGRITARTPKTTVHADAHDLLIFPPTAINRYGFDRPTRYWEAHIHFAPPPNHGRQVWLDGIGALPLRLSLGDAFPRVRQVFITICSELALPGASHRARVVAAVWDLLAILGERIQSESAPKALTLDLWQRVRMRLSQDFQHPVRLAAIAAEERITLETLSRGFRRRFGVTPGQYRSQQKLRHAAQRLRAGDITIKALALEMGFTDSYSFTRAFRRYLGVLPSHLRSGVAAPTVPFPDPEHPLLRINEAIVPAVHSLDFWREATVR
jgi:AraC-like DNA-binding protein